MGAGDALAFGILGPLELRRDGEPVAIGRPKQRAVLALLVTEAGRTVSVDRMIDELWGDEAPAKATASLQAYVSNLRRILEPDRPPGSTGSVLVTEPPGYRLAVAGEQVDSTRFELLAAAARERLEARSPADALDAATSALALWRGPALVEFRDDRFAESTIARVEELRHTCEEDRAAAMLALGLHATAVAELEAAVREQPLRERRWVLLITALYRSGRSPDALDRFQQLRRILRDELGLDPSPELVALERAVLDHDESVLAPSPVEPAPVAPPPHARRAVPDPAPPPADPSESTLLERGRELDEVGRALRDVAAGRTRVLVIEGEAGLGKTTLAEEAAERARRLGIDVAWGGCHEDGDAPALWPWTQILRGLGAEVPDAGDTSDAFAVLEGLAAALADRGGRNPVMGIVEDVHWADPATLRMLAFVAVELRDAPVLLVVTARSDERRDVVGPAIAALLRHPGAVHLHLQPLSPTATDALAHAVAGDRLGDARGLHERTGGNPLFVTELARLLAAEGAGGGVPVGVREVIARRLRRLPEDANAVLALAAVAGAEVDLQLLSATSGVAPDRVADLLDAAVAIGVMRPGSAPARLAFAHALVRETVLASVSDLHRRRLHARLASTLEPRAPAGGPAVYEWAHHAVEAVPFVDPAQARGAAERAATQADAELAFDTAARWWRAALDVHASSPDLAGDDATRGRLLLGLAGSLSREGADTSAQALIVEALDLAEGRGDTSLAVDAATALGQTGGAWLWVKPGSDPTTLLERFERALAALDPGDDRARAAVLGTLAVGQLYGPTPLRGDELSADAVAAARRAGDPETLGRALAVRWRSVWRPGYAPELLAIGEELDELGRRVPGTGFDLDAAVCLHVAHLTLADVPRAQAALDRVVELARERRLIQFQAQLLPMAATLDILRGDLAGAEHRIDEVVGLWDRIQFAFKGAQRSLLLYLLRREQGRLGEVIDDVDATTATPMQIPRWQAAVELERGERERAATRLAAGAGHGLVEPSFDGVANACLDVDLAVELGVHDVTARAADALAPYAGELAAFGTAGCLGPAALWRARALAHVGRADEAVASFRLARDVAARNGLATSVVWAEVGLAAVLGDTVAAAEVAAAAERLGLAAAAREARAVGTAPTAGSGAVAWRRRPASAKGGGGRPPRA